MKMKRILTRLQESGSCGTRSGSSSAQSQPLKQPSSSSSSVQSQRLKQPTGLLNLGNSCYLNSVLQCLTYTPPLAEFCLRQQHSSSCTLSSTSEGDGGCPFCLVERRIARSRKIACAIDSPQTFRKSLHVFAKHFAHGRQEDAHEFLTYVLGACDDVCVEMAKQQNGDAEDDQRELPDTIIKKIFGSTLQSRVKCLTCGAQSITRDDIMDVSLELPEEVTSLQNALSCYFAKEILDGDNLYRCEKCENYTEARKQMSIFRPPNVLVIQLKRFMCSPSGGKIKRAISFPKGLELGEFMSPEEVIGEDHEPRQDYSLFATIIHKGSSQDSGHYYAYVKDENGRWYRCNDSKVSPVSEEEVVADNEVYLLFFIRSVHGEGGNFIGRHVSSLEMSNTSDDENASIKGKMRTHSYRGDGGETDEEYGKRPSKIRKSGKL